MDVERLEMELASLERCRSRPAYYLLSALEELSLLRIATKNEKPLWAHTVRVVSKLPPDDIILRWAGLYHDIGKPAVYGNKHKSIFANHEEAGKGIWRTRAEELGMPEKKIVAVETVIGAHMRVEQYQQDWTNKALKRLIDKCGGQIDRCVALALADGGHKGRIAHLKERLEKWI